MPPKKHNSLNPAPGNMVDSQSEVDEYGPYDQEAGERTSLIPRSDEIRNGGESDVCRQTSNVRSAYTVTIAIGAVIMLANFSSVITMAPRLAIFEDVICRQFYSDRTDIAGAPDCKIEPVQSEVAFVNGWEKTLSLLPGLALSIPYGALADRFGRSKVLTLAFCGVIMNESWVAIVCAWPQIFPIRAVLFSGVFTLVGGGPTTVVSMTFAIISDACRADQRTTAFSMLQVGFLLSELISTPLGAAFIAVNPWIPIVTAIATRIAFTLVLFAGSVRYGNAERLKKKSPTNDIDESSPAASPLPNDTGAQYRYGAVAWITKDVALVLLAFFCVMVNREASDLLLQYSSIKVHWNYAKASYLVSVRAAINIVVLFALIPGVTRYFKKRRVSSPRIDQYITVASGVLLALGSVLIFAAETPAALVFGQVVTAFGFSFTVTARSFVTTLVDARYMGVLSTTVTIASHCALAFGGPFLAWTFKVGLGLGHAWFGMPFLVEGILFALGTVLVLLAAAPAIIS
ncbi:major facilitator superfamily domain-containing protein [Xylaria longipes]|nr:major facilitator superfamily domain-containing protein [Xylaria longipes]